MDWLKSVAAGVVVLAVLLLGGMPGQLLAGEEHEHGHGAVKLQKPLGDACIRDEDWMRRNHMDLLKHKRAITVREGVRVPDESLLNCKTCHTSREQFCDQCHTYVGVKPDCFECHNYPK